MMRPFFLQSVFALSLLLGVVPAAAKTRVAPYLEIGQIVTDNFSDGQDVLTYSMAAAGIEARISGRRAALQSNVRYERRIGWDRDRAQEGRLSGVVRGQYAAIPGLLSLEAGALASRTRLDQRGPAFANSLGRLPNSAQLYSVFAGPSLATSIANMDLQSAYRIGYTRAETGAGRRCPHGRGAGCARAKLFDRL